jgi:GNAT superfamily N-acetyltransferase
MIDVLHEVVVTPRRAFPQLPDLRVIERPGWLQIVTPSIKNGGMNEVIHSALADADADAVIDETIALYRGLGLAFRWNAGPGSAPANLGERLVRRGLAESWGRGMACATTLELAQSACTVERVGTDRVDDFTHAMATGWNADPAPLAALHRQQLAEGNQHLFVAYADGQPVGAASYQAFERSAFLRGGVVLPASRGRGVYRALVAARLAHAQSLGIALATTHAREATSAPILEHLGFDTICRFAMYTG